MQESDHQTARDIAVIRKLVVAAIGCWLMVSAGAVAAKNESSSAWARFVDATQALSNTADMSYGAALSTLLIKYRECHDALEPYKLNCNSIPSFGGLQAVLDKTNLRETDQFTDVGIALRAKPGQAPTFDEVDEKFRRWEQVLYIHGEKTTKFSPPTCQASYATSGKTNRVQVTLLAVVHDEMCMNSIEEVKIRIIRK